MTTGKFTEAAVVGNIVLSEKRGMGRRKRYLKSFSSRLCLCLIHRFIKHCKLGKKKYLFERWKFTGEGRDFQTVS